MNYQIQLCGLIIVLFIFGLCLTHKKLQLHSEKVFLVMLILTIACLAFDISSVFVIVYKNNLNEIFVHAICKIYLVLMVWVGWAYFCYVTLDLNIHPKLMKVIKLIMTGIAVVGSLFIAISPIATVYDGNKILYTEGPAVYSTYIFAVFFILLSLGAAIFVLYKKNSRRGLAMLITTIAWLVAAAIQFFFNELLLVGFAMSAGIMIAFAVLDNPDANLDRQFGCFNSYALSNFITYKLMKKENFSLLDISISDVKFFEDKNVNVIDCTKKVVSIINNYKEIKLFKNLDSGLIAIAEKEEELNQAYESLCEFLNTIEGANQGVTIFSVKNAEKLETRDNLYKYLAYVRSKNSGISSLITHTSENTLKKYREIQQIEQEIKDAIAEDRIEVFYQPIYDLALNRASACEALARIRDKDGSLISPGKFIPIAENTGLIKNLGEIVLDKVCKVLKNTNIISLGISNVHVNLSAVQCDDKQTASTLIKIVENNGVEPKYITFEITETAVSSNKEALLENMNTLISKGFTFSLDDFGKGESNLMYIVDLPVDSLKIDMDLSKAYFYNPKARIVAQSISNMAKMLSVPFVAEGIESYDEAQEIMKCGITHIQGYCYSKPLSLSDFIKFMEGNNSIPNIKTKSSKKAKDTNDFYRVKIKNNHILLVEDNQLCREIVYELLTSNGYEVETATDGIYALDIVSKSQPGKYDLILMDIRMPIMDGLETTRRIRALPDKKISNIPIIALSAMNTDELKNKALKVGITNQLSKPFSIDDFKRVVECDIK